MEDDNAGVIGFPPAIFGGSFVAGSLLGRVLKLPRPPKWPARLIGTPLMIVSGLLAREGFATLKAHGTNVDPYESTTAIVRDGPYAFTRNPLYLSLTMLYAGLGLVTRNSTALALLPLTLAVINRGVIDREEAYLERKFGDDYLQYKNSAPRWLF